MKTIPIRLTLKRTLLGGGLSLLFVLMTAGHVTTRQWTVTHGVMFGAVAICVSWWLALTIKTDPQAKATALRRFRNHMLLWIVTVVVMFAVFHVMDAFHIPYRRLVP